MTVFLWKKIMTEKYTQLLLPGGEWLSSLLLAFELAGLKLETTDPRSYLYTLVEQALPIVFDLVRASSVPEIINEEGTLACGGLTGTDVLKENGLSIECTFPLLTLVPNAPQALLYLGTTPNYSASSDEPQFVAIDLITDAEHGPDSTAILVTTSQKLAQQVKNEVEKNLSTLSTRETIQESLRDYGAIMVVKSLSTAIRISNDYAPEHMQIMTKQPLAIAAQITNAGSIFVGPWSAKAAGDYASGANHVLPTGQAAKTTGPLGVESFGKWIEFQQLTQAGLMKISRVIETFAKVEGLPAHKLSSQIRRKNEN